jgi:hypothetical protein
MENPYAQREELMNWRAALCVQGDGGHIIELGVAKSNAQMPLNSVH